MKVLLVWNSNDYTACYQAEDPSSALSALLQRCHGQYFHLDEDEPEGEIHELERLLESDAFTRLYDEFEGLQKPEVMVGPFERVFVSGSAF